MKQLFRLSKLYAIIFTVIKRRVIQLIESKGIGKERFFSSIGVTSANFRGSLLNSALSSSTIEKIISEIPDLNLEWLLTGKGEMLKGKTEAIDDSIEKSQQRTIEDLTSIIKVLTNK